MGWKLVNVLRSQFLMATRTKSANYRLAQQPQVAYFVGESFIFGSLIYCLDRN
jgi:hypothetical protein